MNIQKDIREQCKKVASLIITITLINKGEGSVVVTAWWGLHIKTYNNNNNNDDDSDKKVDNYITRR